MQDFYPPLGCHATWRLVSEDNNLQLYSHKILSGGKWAARECNERRYLHLVLAAKPENLLRVHHVTIQ